MYSLPEKMVHSSSPIITNIVPSLPVPPLKQTCELYLSFLEPIVEAEELKQTEILVEEFLKAGGVGERLQRGLERKASNTENWLTDDYVKFEYLDRRKPVVVYSNHGMVLPHMNFRNKQEQISDTLPVEYMGGKPLCMKQYERVLSSCRIPGPKTDTLVFHAKTSNAPKHISVVHNCQFFVLDVYNSDGTLLTVDQLYVQLERICKASPQTTTEPVGILTTQNRDVWSRTYSSLIQDETNKESLSAIERSIFTVCLDRANRQEPDKMRHSAILQILHGGGSQCNSGNRWFDKGLQLMVNLVLHQIRVCFVSCLISFLSCGNRMKPKMTQSHTEPLPLPLPQKLHFKITPEIKKDIEDAKQDMLINFSLLHRMARDLNLRVTVFEHFGKNYLKAHKISPDAFVQMALQLAYYRMYQQCCSTFEPASLRMFKLGRVAGIHSNSKASAAFVKAFDDPNIKNSVKVDLLDKAVKAHKWYTHMAINGQAIEGHLLGLRMQTGEENISMPELFTDSSFTKAFNYQISTSQVISKSSSLPCVGPETPDIYDVCYSVLSDRISLIVSRFEPPNTCKEKNAECLIEAMVDALLDMRTMLELQEAV
uniref:Carnitine O-acetyltransferase a n=1 Tax=Seriola dumerili TaxID=41447 RepID=A0A3B4V5R3_SERDU